MGVKCIGRVEMDGKEVFLLVVSADSIDDAIRRINSSGYKFVKFREVRINYGMNNVDEEKLKDIIEKEYVRFWKRLERKYGVTVEKRGFMFEAVCLKEDGGSCGAEDSV